MDKTKHNDNHETVVTIHGKNGKTRTQSVKCELLFVSHELGTTNKMYILVRKLMSVQGMKKVVGFRDLKIILWFEEDILVAVET